MRLPAALAALAAVVPADTLIDASLSLERSTCRRVGALLLSMRCGTWCLPRDAALAACEQLTPSQQRQLQLAVLWAESNTGRWRDKHVELIAATRPLLSRTVAGSDCENGFDLLFPPRRPSPVGSALQNRGSVCFSGSLTKRLYGC
eukprot:TRINITY_DN1963_c0_g1_i5.p1 TRINITY_DN1963_c0_g1~~TRINITY_DN1963_c0_g1_i5.p1  ORF type:complete len:146 (+),score=18.39 TRINITY_DN1963_c0_g1_i5:434-871(+)